MHSILRTIAARAGTHFAFRLLSAAGGLLWLAFFAVAPTAHAQTFVAEWAEADIGRLGPVGMALDTINGVTYLYVADDPNGRIIKIDVSTGTRVAAWGQTGNGPLEFNAPYGIAIDPTSHDLYVTERGNHRVQRITSDGKFVMAWGSLGTGQGQFDGPIGVAADASGNVYVVDHNNNRVEKFNVQQSGTTWNAQFVAAWGGPGSGNGEFDGPYGITLDSKGTLWVADGRNHRLQKFDTNGYYLGSVGTFGTGDGQFVTPVWVNFDAAGNYYVAETNSDPQNLSAADIQNQRIQKFSPSGTFLLKWGSYGEAGGQFKLPFDIVIDAAGNAYVSDYYNTRLQVFSFSSSGGTGGGTGGGTSSSQMANVSARLRASDDPSRALIAGFVVKGTTPKQMLIRAIGPTLAQFGLSGTLPDPSLQIYSGSTVVAKNDDWGGDAAIAAAATKLGAFGLDPKSKDAALLVTLAPGVYTAQVGANGGTGIALVEVYDADGLASSKVVNLSTRGFVDTGDGVLDGGFVISGTSPKRVLIRGVGPTLSVLGVTGVLADPMIKIYGANNTLVAQNDNWETAQPVTGGPTPGTAADITAAENTTGAFGLPTGSKDAAVLVTLPPGAYTAILSGVSNTTGNALIEVYDVPTP